MARLELESVTTVLRELTSGDPPPSWKVGPTEGDPVAEVQSRLEGYVDDDPPWPDPVDVKPEHGSFELALPRGSNVDVAGLLRWLDPGRSAALSADAGSSDRVAWWTTAVDGHAVIGPGGRACLQRLRSRDRLTLIARRRVRPLDTTWRSVDRLVGRLEAYLATWRGAIVDAQVGYYEAAKTTQQDVMDFSLQLIIDNDLDQDEGNWRAVVVEPLVDSVEFGDLWDGSKFDLETVLFGRGRPSRERNGIVDSI